jgi:hypothetical protein
MDCSVQKISYIIPKIYKVYDVNQKVFESSINFNMTILENEIKNNKNLNLKCRNFLFIFKSIFERKKQTWLNKEIQLNLKWKKILLLMIIIIIIIFKFSL